MVASPSLCRIHYLLKRLEQEDQSISYRLLCWRLMIDAAHEGHDEEVTRLESLNVPMADPATEVPIVL